MHTSLILEQNKAWDQDLSGGEKTVVRDGGPGLLMRAQSVPLQPVNTV